MSSPWPAGKQAASPSSILRNWRLERKSGKASGGTAPGSSVGYSRAPASAYSAASSGGTTALRNLEKLLATWGEQRSGAGGVDVDGDRGGRGRAGDRHGERWARGGAIAPCPLQDSTEPGPGGPRFVGVPRLCEADHAMRCGRLLAKRALLLIHTGGQSYSLTVSPAHQCHSLTLNSPARCFAPAHLVLQRCAGRDKDLVEGLPLVPGSQPVAPHAEHGAGGLACDRGGREEDCEWAS